MLKVPGLILKKGPLYTAGPFAVYVGCVDKQDGSDLDHYMIVNTDHLVTEGSQIQLSTARLMAFRLSEELEAQDRLLEETGVLESQPSNAGNKNWN